MKLGASKQDLMKITDVKFEEQTLEGLSSENCVRFVTGNLNHFDYYEYTYGYGPKTREIRRRVCHVKVKCKYMRKTQ